MRGPRRRQLEAAEDVVLGDVAADPHEIAPARVAHDEVEVGDPAGQRLGLDRPAPERQPRRPRPRRPPIGGHRVSPSRARVRAAAAVIIRSAIIASMAMQAPATSPAPTSARVSAM